MHEVVLQSFASCILGVELQSLLHGVVTADVFMLIVGNPCKPAMQSFENKDACADRPHIFQRLLSTVASEHT